MAERLRLGVIGVNANRGWASRVHMPALPTLLEYELRAVCTSKRESAEAAAEKYQTPRAYWDYRDLVADPEVDVVDICVPVRQQHEIAMAALEAGKHVFCEWPLAVTVAQAIEMADLASRKGLHTMVGLQARWNPGLVRLRQLVADGWVGRVLSASATFFIPGLLDERAPELAYRGDRANGAHTLAVVAGHTIDTLCWCVGSFTEVSAVVETLAPEWPLQGGGTVKVTAPDHVSVAGRLAGGGVAAVSVGSVPSHGPPVRIEIYGTEGTLMAQGTPGLHNRVRLQGARRGESEFADLEIPAELDWVPAEATGVAVQWALFSRMMRGLAEGIREGNHPGATFADAARHHQLLDAIDRASQSGRAVRVES